MQLSLPKQIRSMKIKISYWENNKLILLNASFELVLFFFYSNTFANISIHKFIDRTVFIDSVVHAREYID